MKILVLGGTGYVGGNLIPRLTEDNYQVRCLVRENSNLNINNVEIVDGDATDLSAVESAVFGCEQIVYLIHSMGNQTAGFETLDGRIAANVASAAQKYKVKKIIYLGGLGRKDLRQTAHLRSRHQVAEILRSSNVPVTELRAAVIIGAGSASFEMIRSLVQHLPIMICPKWVNVKTQPIAIVDVIDYIVHSLKTAEALDQTFDIGGPDILSYRDMMLTVSQQIGLRRLIIPVPVLTPWLSSHWVNLVTSVSAPLARALIESVKSETICENKNALEFFNLKPIGFDEAVRRALAKDNH